RGGPGDPDEHHGRIGPYPDGGQRGGPNRSGPGRQGRQHYLWNGDRAQRPARCEDHADRNRTTAGFANYAAPHELHTAWGGATGTALSATTTPLRADRRHRSALVYAPPPLDQTAPSSYGRRRG